MKKNTFLTVLLVLCYLNCYSQVLSHKIDNSPFSRPLSEQRLLSPQRSMQHHQSADAASGYCGADGGTNLQWSYDGQSTLTITGSGQMQNYESTDDIPWYNYVDSITTINLSNGITSIGSAAFFNCYNLEKITLPSSVKKIGNNAFAFCSLATITLTAPLEELGYWAFRGVQNVVYPSEFFSRNGGNDFRVRLSIHGGMILLNGELPVISPREAWEYARPYKNDESFSSDMYISALVKGKVWEAEESSNLYTLAGWGKLESINLGETGEYYGEYYKLDYIYVINGVLDDMNYRKERDTVIIQCNIFGIYKNSDDQSKTIKKDYQAFIRYAYSYRGKGNVIGAYSLEINQNHNTAGIRFIGNGDNLDLAQIPEEVTLNGTTYPVTYLRESAFNYTSFGGIVNMEKIKGIYPKAFANSLVLYYLSIDKNIEYIGNDAFYGCPNLSYVHWNPSNSATFGQDLFNKSTAIEELVVGNEVTALPSSLCSGWTNLKSVSLPSTLQSIGSSTFRGCSSLTKINLPSSIDRIEESTFQGCSSLTDISLSPSIKSIGASAFQGCSSLKEVSIPTEINNIAASTFKGCYSLTSMTLPPTINSIGSAAFSGCKSLTSIYNYRERPCTFASDAFQGVDYFGCTLYVPNPSLEMYKSQQSDWKIFYNIEPISAEPVSTNGIEITPETNTADFVWPTITGATTYELIIRDTDGNIVCTLTFDAQGHLTQIAFAAPARTNAPEQTQAAGFAFTVTGLNSGTTYNYTITSKDVNGKVLDTKTGTFTTDGATALDNTYGNQNAGIRKVFENGQLYILNGSKTYNLQGMEVKCLTGKQVK